MRNGSTGTEYRRTTPGSAPAVRRAALGLVAAGLGVAMCGCSSTAGSSGDTGAQVSRKPGAAASEVPAFASDLARVCADGLGFPGLPAYSRSSKAVHPAVLMNKGGKIWSQNSPLEGDFPRGWILGYADDVKKAQLVVCYERTGTTPAGKTCAMQDSKTKKPLTVTMYNTSYKLRVLQASTGKPLYEHVGKAASTTCPLLTYTLQGNDPTKYYTEARPADYRKLIKRFIAT
jgi:hypothetical protein